MSPVCWSRLACGKIRALREGTRKKKEKYWMNSSRGLAMASHTNSPNAGKFFVIFLKIFLQKKNRKRNHTIFRCFLSSDIRSKIQLNKGF